RIPILSSRPDRIGILSHSTHAANSSSASAGARDLLYQALTVAGQRSSDRRVSRAHETRSCKQVEVVSGQGLAQEAGGGHTCEKGGLVQGSWPSGRGGALHEGPLPPCRSQGPSGGRGGRLVGAEIRPSPGRPDPFEQQLPGPGTRKVGSPLMRRPCA